MRLVDQWRELEAALPDDWNEVALSVVPEEEAEVANVSAMLGPMGPGRVENTVRVTVCRAGGASGPEAARRLFRLLDERRVWATLVRENVVHRPAELEVEASAPLVVDFEAALATLPGDWSDLLCEVEVESSDYLARAALLCSPINPTRAPAALAFTFRVAQRVGYGVSPAMARRCFERCDAEGIAGSVRVLRILSATDGVGTQGPVWYVAGKVL